MSLTSKAVIILCGLRFPENAGMAARACANMGCTEIRLVRPERYDLFKAFPLATAIGRPILEKIRIYENISDAVKDLVLLFGTSARSGDRRKKILNPGQFAEVILNDAEACLAGAGDKFGLLFGPEDRGLANEDLSLCEAIIRIPTAPKAGSLNIAQAVLLVLYEIFTATSSINNNKSSSSPGQNIHIGDLELLETRLRQLLLALDALPEKNSNYFFSQWHDMLSRLHLKRHEFDALMGLCRQLRNKCEKWLN